jgi:hypothetical protein
MTTFEFDRWADDDNGWDGWCSAPGIALFGNAIQVWAICNGGMSSVADAARVFNCDPARIIEAVDSHYWMFLSGPHDDYARLMIEHEGE